MTSILNNLLSKGNSKPNVTLNFLRFENQKVDAAAQRIDATAHKVNNLEKRFLVWTGKFKSVDEVPNFVGQAIVERARNRMRIKIANYMMLATALGCIAMIYSGKQAAKKGESVQKENIQWHKELKESAAK